MLTVYGIETLEDVRLLNLFGLVATVLTVYGIETFDALKRTLVSLVSLQQCLPFTVLKLTSCNHFFKLRIRNSCNSAYRLRY